MASRSSSRDQAVEKNLVYGMRSSAVVHVLGFSANSEGSCVGAEGIAPEQLEAITPGLDRAMASVEFPG